MQPFPQQNLVITGANEGIGYETMRHLFLTNKFNIIFGSRNMQKNQEAKDKLLQQFVTKHPNTKPPLLEFFKLDLGSKKGVEEFVANVKQIFNKIQVLINNAGALFNERQIVKDEISFDVEKTLLVNYFAVFYLIYMFFQSKLIDKSGKDQVRIINVSSSAHSYCQNDMFEDLDCKSKFYSTYRQYSIAKFFVTTFTTELAQRLRQSSMQQKHPHPTIKTVSLHPGVINTNIGNDVMLARVIKFVSRLWMKSNAQGAKSTISLSEMKFSEIKNGGYYDEDGKEAKADKRTGDSETRRRVWELSEKAWGVRFQV